MSDQKPAATLPAPSELPEFAKARTSAPTPSLVVIWSVDEPDRVGEVLFLPSDGREVVLGRAEEGETPDGERLGFVRQRPTRQEPGIPLTSRYISRVQLKMSLSGSTGIDVTCVGQCPMMINGTPAASATLQQGDVLELQNQLSMVCVRRPRRLQLQETVAVPPFGEPDAAGMVGESPAVWELRQSCVRAGRRRVHVLIHGPSGSGKELMAQGIHAAASSEGVLVSRNAATLPEGLIDAELFGNLRNYPNPGMTERPGLVGEANGGTLFLDEIGELPHAAQTHMLRVLDEGEYQRLGESRTRRSRFRLVGATNRPPSQLKSDVLARLKLRLEIPGLNGRIEDIPLIVRHLLRKMAREDRTLAKRFFWDEDPDGHPRITPALTCQLVRHTWTTNVRELESVLWQAVDASTGTYLDVSDDLSVETAPSTSDPGAVTAAQIQACMERHKGVREKVWRELGLANRHVLARLMKKHGISGG
jgi:DNA-binding NtrC family response regulator